MKKYALEHLNDEDYCDKYDYIHDQLTNTLVKVLDEWIEEGVITEKDKEAALEDFIDDRMGILSSLLGGN